jgi:PAS domain S-box-containing protein
LSGPFSPLSRIIRVPASCFFYRASSFFFLCLIISGFTAAGLLSGSASAQTIRNFTSITGKKDVAVNCIIQGADGDLWMGTAGGLVIYDGENVKLFNKENGLQDDNVTALLLASDGTMWIGQNNGKITLLHGGQFYAFNQNEKLGDQKISAFAEAGGIWIATYGGGIYSFSNNELKAWNSEKGLSDDYVYTLYNDGKGNLWAGTDAGITHITVSGNAPSFAVMSMHDGLPDNIVRSISADLNGDIWLAMQDSGVCRYDVKEGRFLRVDISRNWRYGAITSLDFDRSGGLYIGTKKSGVVKYLINGDGQELLRVFDVSAGLLDNEVNAIYSDREKNLWVGSAKGLSVMNHGRISFLSVKNGLLSDKVHALHTDSRGNYWIATDRGLVKYSYLPDGEVKMKNYFLTEGTLEKQVTCICEDAQGILWFGTYGQGLFRFDPVSEKQERIDHTRGLSNDNVSSLCTDKKGNLWIATLGGAVCSIAPGSTSVRSYAGAEGLNADYVYCVFADSKDRLWIGTDGNGLVRLENGTFASVTANSPVKGKTVYTVTEDKEGSIWFTMNGAGVYKYDGSNFTGFSSKNGLRDNDPPILVSTGENVFTVHPKGIDMIDKEGRVSFYAVSDNDIEPNLNAAFTDREGNIWFGTNSGAVKFRSYQVPADTITPLVRFSSLLVQFQPFPMDSTHDFSYRQNNFIFNFSAVWLRSDENVRFRYRLEGSDSNYFETNDKVASYPSLPPGNYTFLVSAANGEGKWGPPVKFSFSIATPLWQRWWFWVITVGFTGAGIYFFIQYRLRALQKEKQVLEEKVQERTAEILEQTKIIEAKNKELERLSIVARETGNVIIIMDAEGRLEWVNYSFEKVNGITLEELKKLKGESIYEISNNPEIRNIISTCIREKKSVVYESRNILQDGRIIWESSTLTPIYDEGGKLRKLIIIDTDVTERKAQEEIIRQKNKDITDSIEYAKKIQTSILPSLPSIKQALPKSFVFYLQKDIVSGDFYWFAQKGDQAIIAVVDCTGHGVPGAFMSLIGYNILNQVVNEKEITEPDRILDELNKGVIKALYQNNPNNTSKDGMDAAICRISLRTREVEFAGAMRPLYIFRGNEFEEMKGDKMPIGTKEGEREHAIKFTNHRIKADKGEVFYICSDGYADQFGGGVGKKMMTKNFKLILGNIKDLPFDKQCEELMKKHKEWKGDFEQVDDILVIGFSL